MSESKAKKKTWIKVEWGVPAVWNWGIACRCINKQYWLLILTVFLCTKLTTTEHLHLLNWSPFIHGSELVQIWHNCWICIFPYIGFKKECIPNITMHFCMRVTELDQMERWKPDSITLLFKMLSVRKPDIFCIPCKLRVCKFPKNSIIEHGCELYRCHPYHFMEICKPPVNEPIGSYQIHHLKPSRAAAIELFHTIGSRYKEYWPLSINNSSYPLISMISHLLYSR